MFSLRQGQPTLPLALWVAAQAQGYASGLWGTYRQWQAVGAQVRKGERGTTAVLWKSLAAAGDEDEDEPARGRVVARAFTLFNVAQVDDYVTAQAATVREAEQLPVADAFVAALGIPVNTGAYDPHYRIDLDRVFMPPATAFADTASHLGTLLHEYAHNAVTWIMPRVLREGQASSVFAAHRFGIIRGISGAG